MLERKTCPQFAVPRPCQNCIISNVFQCVKMHWHFAMFKEKYEADTIMLTRATGNARGGSVPSRVGK